MRVIVVLGVLVAATVGCTIFALVSPRAQGAAMGAPGLTIHIVAAENFYGNIASQIGGPYVSVTSLLANPSADPHSFESSPTDAQAVASAALVVQNGLGYDDFMRQIEAATPATSRSVIDVGMLMGRHIGDNPHQWYDPATADRVAMAIAQHLANIDPAHASVFQHNANGFRRTVSAYRERLNAVASQFGGSPVAVTEPVFNYALARMHLRIITPEAFQLAVEDGNDPAPQAVQMVDAAVRTRGVRVLIYNNQAVSSVTTSLKGLAAGAGVPVVGVYETMPSGFTYQSWMQAEVAAVERALNRGTSTEAL